MNLPVASASVAVLVLAWDETTPAARVLVEAPAAAESPLDSVVALVPTGPAADELSQEEFLPLEASTTLPEPPTAREPLPEIPAKTPSTEGMAVPAEAAVPDPLLPVTTIPADLPPPLAMPAATAPAAPLPAATPAAATAAALVTPALVWQEVRVLHFGTSLGSAEPATAGTYLGQGAPTFVWTGAAAAPAAPYLGSSEPTLTTQEGLAIAALTHNPAVAAALLAPTDTAATALRALRTLGLAGSATAMPTSAVPALNQAPAYLLAELPAASDAEQDATPPPTASEPAPTTEASTTELSEEAAAPEEAFAVDTTPVQATEPAMAVPPTQAAPAHPAAEPELFAPAEAPQLAALRLPAQPFDAPDLNFQIIQYARMAVPQAVREQPFGVIYAPAWPTWLAAQELRHRSGQPLVLHIAKLAAADDELIELAAGWVAELQRQALHRADLILTETPALAQRLRHELALPAHRVRTVPAADAVAVAQALRTAQRH